MRVCLHVGMHKTGTTSLQRCLAEGGKALATVFLRLWRSLKQEAVYLEEIADGFQARRVISNWMAFYNTERPHSSLERRTPKEAYWRGRNEKLAA